MGMTLAVCQSLFAVAQVILLLLHGGYNLSLFFA